MGHLSVFVPGRPAPQGSKRHVGNGRLIESSRAVGPWRDLIATTTRDVFEPVDGPLRVDLKFVMPRRKREPKRVAGAHTRRPDVDKLTRAVLDALTGIAYHDDSQVTGLSAEKRSAELYEEPGVLIRVTSPMTTSRPISTP